MKHLFIVFVSILFNFCLEAQTTSMSSGSGIVLTKDGYIATNNHVIEGGLEYFVDVFTNGIKQSYKAKVVQTDVENDLAVLKIEDPLFKQFKTIPYAFKMQGINVGEKVFAMGYPRPGIQGEEVKVTDGLISSKTGYQNDNKTYQISAPIQPGNSGGPLFDYSGNLIGLTSSGIPSGENVGYAIKISYLNNMLDLIPNFPTLSASTSISSLSFTDKIKTLSNYTVMIRVVIPVCDFQSISMLYSEIQSYYSVEMINQTLKKEGVLLSKSEHSDLYKWNICESDLSKMVLATFLDGKLANISKSFDDRSQCLNLSTDLCSSIKIGQSYDFVTKITGIEGDNKMLSFQNGSKLYAWYDCTSTKILMITFNEKNLVVSVSCI